MSILSLNLIKSKLGVSIIITLVIALSALRFLPNKGSANNVSTMSTAPQPSLGLIPGQDSPKNITPFIEQLPDGEILLIADLGKPGLDFHPVEGPIINESFNTTLRWYRFRIRNASERPGTWYLTTSMRTPIFLGIYEHSAGKTNVLVQTHSNDPYSKRSIDHRHLFAEISLQGGEEKEIYIHLEKMGLRYIPQLVTQETRIRQQFYDYCWIIFFLTCLGTLLIVNLSQFLATRNSLYLYYSSAVFWSAFSVTHHDGYNFRFLWPDYPFVDFAFSYYVGVPTALSIIQVVRKALRLDHNAPLADRLLKLSMMGWFLSIPATMIFDSAAVVNFMSVVISPFTFLVLILSSYASIKHRVPSAYFYLAGWLCYGVGLSAFVMLHSDVNWLTDLSNTTRVYAIAILLEGFLFYFGVANQVRVMQAREMESRQTTLQLLEDKLTDMESVAKIEQEKKHIQQEAVKHSMQFASASHDMHQPLFTIRAILASIKDDINDKKVLKEIDSAFEYLNQILNAALETSRDQMSQPTAQVSVTGLFEEIFARHIHAATEKGLTLKIAQSTLSVMGSKIILSRILDNLIRNAIRYTQYGKVLVGVRKRTVGVEFQVLDTGVGIPDKDLSRLLQPFERGKSTAASSQHNYGLGLAITKMLCDQQGYEFSIQSEVGRGSVFSIHIPA